MARKKHHNGRGCHPNGRHGREDDDARRHRQACALEPPPESFNAQLPVVLKQCAELPTSETPADCSKSGSYRGPASLDTQPSLTLSLAGGPKVDVSLLPTSQLLVSFSSASPHAPPTGRAQETHALPGGALAARGASLEEGGSRGAHVDPRGHGPDAGAGHLAQSGPAEAPPGTDALKLEGPEKEAVHSTDGTSGNQALTVRGLLRYLKGLRSHIDSITASKLEHGLLSKRQSCDGEASCEGGGSDEKPLDTRALSAAWRVHDPAAGAGDDSDVHDRGMGTAPRVSHVARQTRELQAIEDSQPPMQAAGPRPRVRCPLVLLD